MVHHVDFSSLTVSELLYKEGGAVEMSLRVVIVALTIH
jgi:hypothetical protein